MKARVREMDPGATVDDITTMEAVVARASAPWRMSMWLFVLFAGVAFFLAAMGLFSLVSLDVAHRRRELAVRLALGASQQAVLRGVLSQRRVEGRRRRRGRPGGRGRRRRERCGRCSTASSRSTR